MDLGSGKLRIIFSKDQMHPTLGIVPKFGVRGDFVITASYEIVESEAPTSGTGAGVSLRVLTGTKQPNVATISRFHRVKEGEPLVAYRGSTIEKGNMSIG